MGDYSSGLYEVEGAVNSIYNILAGGLGIAAMLGTIITAVFSLILSIAQWILLAVPLFKLAQKTGKKNAWLAWIPVFGDYFRTFVLADLPGNKEIVLFGKLKIQNRMTAFWIWVGICLFGTLVWDTVMGLISVFFPVGAVATIALSYVPDVAIGFLEYAFLRDVLDMFKADKKSNNTWAIVITVLDVILPWRFARTVCLYGLMNKEPLQKNVRYINAK